MAKNTYGGGAQTNINGLKFEQETDLSTALLNCTGYSIQEHNVLFNNNPIAILAPKNGLYSIILNRLEIDYTQFISKKLLPDEALLNLNNKTIYILEKKFQQVAGSVDEKLQTCDFKKKQYQKLFLPKNIQVEYIYILCDWFKQAKYTDSLNYIKSVGCDYFFNEIPLRRLGLPFESPK